jgi:GNAT superfamily N-acetyltransferase
MRLAGHRVAGGHDHVEVGVAGAQPEEFGAGVARRTDDADLERPWFGTTLVLAEGDHLLGYAVVTLGWSLESGGLDALLDEVYLDPSRRGRGIGSALIEQAVEQARELGARRIYLEVEAANGPARRLYERLGWQPEDSQMLLRWLTQPPAPPG